MRIESEENSERVLVNLFEHASYDSLRGVFLLTDSAGGSPLKNFVKHKKNYFFCIWPLDKSQFCAIL